MFLQELDLLTAHRLSTDLATTLKWCQCAHLTKKIEWMRPHEIRIGIYLWLNQEKISALWTIVWLIPIWDHVGTNRAEAKCQNLPL